MGRFFWAMIDLPARFIGTVIAQFWPLLVFGAAIGAGYFVYRMIGERRDRWPALAVSLVAALYVGLVFADAQKWVAVELLKMQRGDGYDPD